MKTIIAGSRSITDPQVIVEAIKASGFDITEVVCGGARGVNTLGREWAVEDEGKIIPVKMFLAEWDVFGKSAGYRRNAEMAAYADALIAVWDGESKGTHHMINLALKAGLKVYIHKTGEVK